MATHCTHVITIIIKWGLCHGHIVMMHTCLFHTPDKAGIPLETPRVCSKQTWPRSRADLMLQQPGSLVGSHAPPPLH